MVSFGDIVSIFVILILIIEIVSVVRQNILLKEQNKQLAELLNRTKDAAMVIRDGKKHTKDKRSDTEDGNQTGNYRTDKGESRS